MTARRFAIHVLLFVAIIIVMTAIAVWLNLGPVVSSAAHSGAVPVEMSASGLPARTLGAVGETG